MSYSGIIEKQKVIAYINAQLAETTSNYYKSCSGLLPERTFHKMKEHQKVLLSLLQLVENAVPVKHTWDEKDKNEYLDLESKSNLLLPH